MPVYQFLSKPHISLAGAGVLIDKKALYELSCSLEGDKQTASYVPV